jgi:hypothetical protein
MFIFREINFLVVGQKIAKIVEKQKIFDFIVSFQYF